MRQNKLAWRSWLYDPARGAARPMLTRDEALTRVRAFEQRHHVSLPGAYVEAVLEHGGCAPAPGLFTYATTPKVQRNVFNSLLELDATWHASENVETTLKNCSLTDTHPSGVVPFALTPNGDFLCLDLRGPGEPRVVYATHDYGRDPWQLFDVAPSFEALLAGLHEQPSALSVDELEHLRKTRPNDLVVVDLREPAAFAREHLPGAINQPLSSAETARTLALAARGEVLHVVYDQTGEEADALVKRLFDSSTTGIAVAALDGGFLEYQLSHMPRVAARRRSPTGSSTSLEARSRNVLPGSPEAEEVVAQAIEVAGVASGDELVIALECLVRLNAGAAAEKFDFEVLASRGPREVIRDLQLRLTK